MIKITKGKTTLLFGRVLKTKNGFIPAVKMIPISGEVAPTVIDPRTSHD
jgi:hypothetical protein